VPKYGEQNGIFMQIEHVHTFSAMFVTRLSSNIMFSFCSFPRSVSFNKYSCNSFEATNFVLNSFVDS
jgi:hypothetical protein